jgi:hypothetical protein
MLEMCVEPFGSTSQKPLVTSRGKCWQNNDGKQPKNRHYYQ